MTAHCVSIASGAQSHPRRFACLLAPELNSPFLHNARSFPARYDASTQRPARSTAVAPVAFKFMKKLGLQKPAFLPDFGLDKRKAVLDKFYTTFDRPGLNEVIADDFTLRERSSTASQTFSKADWIHLISDCVAPAIPDFTFGHATDAAKGQDGFCVVKVQAAGRHTGAPFAISDKYPKVEAKGTRFLLAEETMLVGVEDGKVQKIEVLPVKGAGPLALYEALGGKVPAGLP